MRSQAIEIAWHNESSVWSVDCSQAEADLRFVTSGNDKSARVWRLANDIYDIIVPVSRSQKDQPSTRQTPAASTTDPSLSPNKPHAERTKRMAEHAQPLKLPVEWICDLSGHSSTVNVARFSPHSTMIASGADGGELMLWAKPAVEDSGSSRSPTRPKERWTQAGIIRGHSADVLDISWSADGKRLASGSVDNTFRVWDIANRKRPLAVITFHDSMVQGVAFDPMNQFIASLGNDRTLALHLASGFQAKGSCNASSGESKVPYFASDMKSNVLFRRLAWSPDGSFLACPSGLAVPTNGTDTLYSVHLFARGTWRAPALQCTGMSKLPIAVAFCPQLFALRRDRSTASCFDLPYRMVFAVACLDCVLIYDTESDGRPVGCVSRIHYAELTDLSWTRDGGSLLVSSCDGSVSVVALSPGEIGTPLPSDERAAWMKAEETSGGFPADTLQRSEIPQVPTPNISTGSEPFTPVTVVPRRKSDAHGPPPPGKYPTMPGPGAREVTVIVPPREPSVVQALDQGCDANDPARKRLKLDEGGL